MAEYDNVYCAGVQAKRLPHGFNSMSAIGKRLFSGPVIPVSLAVLWIVGQIARDATWITGLCFYIPSPILMIVLIVAGIAAWRRKRRIGMYVFNGLALFPLIFILFIENHFFVSRPAQAADKSLRMVHWNVFRGHLGWDAITDRLKQMDADVHVFSEFPKDANVEDLAESFGEDYTSLAMSSLAVLARGSLSEAQWLVEERSLKVFLVRWHSPEGEVQLMVADLSSNPLRPRESRLRRINQLMREHQPDIVVGDFNAPRRSWMLSQLPEGYVHAYEAAGSGWSYTWPVPCPVYAIDQCIVGPGIRPLHYEIGRSLRSDHAWQRLAFTLMSHVESEISYSNDSGESSIGVLHKGPLQGCHLGSILSMEWRFSCS